MAKKASTDIISHWYNLIEGLQASPQAFCASIEQAIQRREIPDTTVFRIEWPEGGPFSPKREYLRVLRKNHTFDICGAPFGKGFFISWWLGELPPGCLGIIFAIPILGDMLTLIFRRFTYYKVDTALMFQESIRTAVQEVIDHMLSTNGIRALSEAERKPIMEAFRRR